MPVLLKQRIPVIQVIGDLTIGAAEIREMAFVTGNAKRQFARGIHVAE